MLEELAYDQTTVIAEISAAFEGVRRGNGNTLQQANWISKWVYCGKDESSEEAQSDHRRMVASVRDTAWQELSDAEIETYDSLAYVHAESLPYYLAPFMIWTVRHYPPAWQIDMPAITTLQAICWNRTEAEPPWRKLNDWSRLDARQKATVHSFARHILARAETIPDVSDIRDLRHAIDGYWHHFTTVQPKQAKQKRPYKK